MRRTIISAIIIFINGCSSQNICNHPIDIQLHRVFPNDIFEINIMSDSTIYKNKFTEYFLIDAHKPRRFLIKNLCINADSINIHFLINNGTDTIFHINPKLVHTIYLGCDQMIKSIYIVTSEMGNQNFLLNK
jgi:hypothetical protein